MKVLIVTNHVPWSEQLVEAFRNHIGTDAVKACAHEHALAVFLTEEPTHVLLDAYNETPNLSEKYRIGVSTYRDLKATATTDERIVRCGWQKYNYSDYIELPFMLEDLWRLMFGETR